MQEGDIEYFPHGCGGGGTTSKFSSRQVLQNKKEAVLNTDVW